MTTPKVYTYSSPTAEFSSWPDGTIFYLSDFLDQVNLNIYAVNGVGDTLRYDNGWKNTIDQDNKTYTYVHTIGERSHGGAKRTKRTRKSHKNRRNKRKSRGRRH
jgi:hypothetical protein